MKLGINDANQEFFDAPLTDWLKKNCGSCDTLMHPWIPWKSVFPQAVWLIWLRQNSFIFQTGRIDANIHVHCIKKRVEFFVIVPRNTNKPPRTQIQVKWSKPNPGWVKLNTNRAVLGTLKATTENV